MSTTHTVVPPASHALLLSRARGAFVRLLFLALGVQLLEVVDATTAIWPDRSVALLGTLVLAGWGLVLVRTGRAGVLSDVSLATTIAVIGLGLGRNGAVLVALVAVLPLRAMYGTRTDVARGTAAMLAGYGVITVVHDGLDHLVDFETIVVVAAVSAFAVTLHYLAELLAHHDLCVRLDEVATSTAARLVAATTTAELGLLEADARQRIATIAEDGAVRDPSSAVDSVERRLTADLRLGRQRIATEARYRTVAEDNRDGLYLRQLGEGLGYAYLNPAGEAILGVPAVELLADPSLPRQLVHEDDLERLVAAVARDGLLTDPIEVRCRRPDGQVRWVSLHERLVEAEGERRTVLGTLRDVTRSRDEAAALQRVIERERAALEHLRHLDAMKSTFLQAVSHELRTPLSAVIGAAQTLDARDDVLTASQRRRMLDIVQRQSSRLERLLTDLLDVDRLSRGLVAPERRPTDLLALAGSVVANLDEKGASRVEVAGEAGTIAVDAPKVERIVDNLVRNAIRHTPADGRIVCRVSHEAAGASIVVEDEGPGVPDELKSELFQPFAQGPGAEAAPSPGTGIGLALVRALAELHDGRAWIEDRPDGGARFGVWLAAEDASADGERVGAGVGTD